MSGWVIQHGQPVRSGDVNNDPRYVEAYPGIRSGLYVPMKLGDRIVGVISVEDKRPDALAKRMNACRHAGKSSRQCI